MASSNRINAVPSASTWASSRSSIRRNACRSISCRTSSTTVKTSRKRSRSIESASLSMRSGNRRKSLTAGRVLNGGDQGAQLDGDQVDAGERDRDVAREDDTGADQPVEQVDQRGRPAGHPRFDHGGHGCSTEANEYAGQGPVRT